MSVPARSQPPAALASDGLHVAIIMDGNGRWAAARGLPRTAGHRRGARVVRRIVEAAPAAGITTLTLYAFSADNWNRPSEEVSTLMRLFRVHLIKETDRCVANGVRLSIIGRRDRLSPQLCTAIADAEHATAGGTTLHLRVAVDYSAREAIAGAAAAVAAAGRPIDRRSIEAALLSAPGGAPDVDLLVRTGGEQRVSDFLLWESAYAELWFTPKMWPEFTPADLEAALREFRGRERRFGRIAV